MIRRIIEIDNLKITIEDSAPSPHSTNGRRTLSVILAQVASDASIHQEHILGTSKIAMYKNARWSFFFEASREGYSPAEIGYFCSMDRTSVVHALNKLKQQGKV